MRWTQGCTISALVALLWGCAAVHPSYDLQATPRPDGRIELAWHAQREAAGSFASYEVQRRTDSGEWTSVAMFEIPRSEKPVWIDSAGPMVERQRLRFRVAAVQAGRATDWSEVVSAVPVFTGLPLYGWVDASKERECRVSGARVPSLQCAIETLGGRAWKGEEPTVGPHVLFLPDGDYEVDRTLWLEGRAGVQFVGQSRGGVILHWTGARGAGPEDASVLFHAEGNRDSSWRNLVWDGGCEDPSSCFVVAFDQSFCGRSDLWILRSETCGAARLGWPERSTVGESDNGGAQIDSTFRNAWIGLRIGHHGVADDTSTVRRCEFSSNYAGVSLEDFNALRHGFWDPLFRDNTVGITNHLAALQFADDPDRRQRHWAGEFSIVRGRFERNSDTDIWAEPTGQFTIRDSVSSGSGRFFFAAGPNTTPGRYSLIGNRIRTTAFPAIESATPGPLMLLDNTIRGLRGSDAAPVVLDSLTGSDPRWPDLGSLDLIALGNRYETGAGNPYAFRRMHRSHLFDDGSAEGPAAIAIPPLPTIVDELAVRPVYTVTGATSSDPLANADRIQQIVDAAAADGRPAVVHLPGVQGRYLVGRTLNVPATSDLVLAGDGPWTTLQWAGPVGQPLLRVGASEIAHLVVRDLQFRGAGIEVSDLDAGGEDLLLSRVRIAEAGEAAMSIEGLVETDVEILEFQANGGLIAAGEGVGIRIRRGAVDDDRLDPHSGGRVAIWSGIVVRNEWDFDVSGAGELLINGLYMERSKHHMRLRGAGTVEEHSVKIATIVPLRDSADAAEIDEAAAAVRLDDYGGEYNLVQSQLFVVDPSSTGESSPAAVDHGARIRLTGGPATVRAVGVTVRGTRDEPPRSLPEFSFVGASPRSRVTRIAGKLATPGALPLPDMQVIGEGLPAPIDSESGEAERTVHDAVRLLRKWTPPGFPDEVGDSGRYRVVFDGVFIFRPPRVGLTLR